MGQKFFEDKIGTLSHSSGSIFLAPSRLTIGGQQRPVLSTLSRSISADVTMAANTLYMVYAVVDSGVVQLRISPNVNSAGPAGFTAWKLVGAFYSNGLVSVGFGSFVNIKGAPETEAPIQHIPSVNFTGATLSGSFFRSGSTLKVTGRALFTAGATGTFSVNFLNGMTLAAQAPSFSGRHTIGSCVMFDSSPSTYHHGRAFSGGPNSSSANLRYFQASSTQLGDTGATPTAPWTWASGDEITFEYEIEVNEWSSISIEDL